MEVIYHGGCLPWRLSSMHVVFHGGHLPTFKQFPSYTRFTIEDLIFLLKATIAHFMLFQPISCYFTIMRLSSI